MSWSRPIRVVGVGSPIGDDALAWEAVEHLQQHKAWLGEIEFHLVEGGQRILDMLDGSGSLILIDAVAPDGQPGKIFRFDWPDPRIEVMRPGSTHDLRPAEALRLADTLGLLPEHVVVWGIVGARFEPNSPMSDVVAMAIPGLVQEIARELERILDVERYCHA